MTTTDSTTYFARNTYTDLGASQTEFQFAFKGGTPLAAGHVEVDVDTGAGFENKLTNDTTFGWTINFTNSTITFGSAPAGSGATSVRIRRNTPVLRLVDYTSGGTLAETDLDTDSLQAIFAVQEILDTFIDAMVLSETDGRWEARGIEVRRAADATQNQSLVTLAQVTALIGGGGNATLNSPIVAYATGDGTTQEFDLRVLTGDNTINSLINTEIFAWVAGEFILHEERIVVDGFKVRFSNMTPAFGDRIEFETLPATIAAVFGENTVDTDALRDSAVTSDKILDGTITSADLADLAITAAKIGALAVTTAKIDALAVTTAKIAAAAVTSAKVETGLNKTPDVQTIALTKAQIFASIPASVENTSGKLREVSVRLRVTGHGSRHEYQMQIATAVGFGTPFTTAEFAYPTGGNQLYTFRALVPATWFWRLAQTDGPGTPESDSDVTLVGVTYTDLPH